MQTLTPWPHAIADVALPWILQSLVIATCALLLARMLRRKGPAAENVVLRFGLIALWLAPAATIALTYLHIDGVAVALPQPSQAIFSDNSRFAQQTTVTVTPASPPPSQTFAPQQRTPIEAQAPESNIDPLAAAYAMIVCLWIIGASYLLIRLATLYATLLYVRWKAKPAPDPIRATLEQHSKSLGVHIPQARAHSSVNGPCVTGILRATILLPHTFATSDPRLIESVLLHELSHAKRRDCAWNLLAYITASILWFQPLLWRIRRRLDETSDLIADDCVIHHRRDPFEYARHLADLAEACMPSRAESLASAGIAPSKSELVKRVRRILDANRLIQLRTSRKLIATIALIAALITTATGVIGAESGGDHDIDPIEGTVYSAKGEPITGATVEFGERHYDGVGEMATMTWTTLASATSAADGSFTISAFRTPKPVRDYDIRVSAPGYVTDWVAIEHAARNPRRFSSGFYLYNMPTANAVLMPARKLGGIVKDASGKPITGVKVRPHDMPNSVLTDANGRFTFDTVPDFEAIPQYGRYIVEAMHPGYVHARAEAPSTANEITITMQRGVLIEGSVIDRDTQKGVPNVSVRGQSRDGQQELASTDSDGKYRLRLLPGQITLALGGRPSYTAVNKEQTVFLAQGDSKSGVDILVNGSFAIRGRIIDLQTGEPIPDLNVRYAAEGARDRMSNSIGKSGGVTDKDGNFSINGLAPGKYFILTYCDDGSISTEKTAVDLPENADSKSVTILAKRKLDSSGNAIPLPMVTGKVIYPDGQPAALAKVEVYANEPHDGIEDDYCHASPDGSFAFSMALIKMSGPGEFRAYDVKKEFISVLEMPDISNPKQPFVITLAKGATFSGAVRDEKGQPLPGISVIVSREVPDGQFTGIHSMAIGVTDASGKYTTSAFVPSSQDKAPALECQSPHDPDSRRYQWVHKPEGKYTNLNVTPGAHSDGLDFTLTINGGHAYFAATPAKAN